MAALKTIEDKMIEINKGLPQLPPDWKNWLAQYAWVFALIGAVVGAILVLVLINTVLFVTAVVTTTDTLGYIVQQPAHHYVALAWLALVVLVGYVAVLAISVPKLKAMLKSGWNLSFYSALFFLGYDIFFWLQSPGAVFNLIGNLIGAAIGFYFLFQIREKFTG